MATTYVSTDPQAAIWTPTPSTLTSTGAPAQTPTGGGGFNVNGVPQGPGFTPNAQQLPPGTTSTDPSGNKVVWNGTAYVPFTGSPWDNGLTTAPNPNAPATPSPTPSSPSTAGSTYTGNPTDATAYFTWLATQPGHDPILDTPGGIAYYVNEATQKGGLNASNLSYWQNKATLASAGGAVGAGGGSGSGSLVNTLPSAADAANMPGIQFAEQQAQKAVENSAAAKGTLLTGGTLKNLADYTTGTALNQGYIPLANLGLNYNQANFSNLYNLAALGLTGSATGSA